MEGDHAPDRLDPSERPCPTSEAVATREGAAHGERKYESRVASLQGVHHHHERQDCHTVDGQHATYDTFVGGCEGRRNRTGNDAASSLQQSQSGVCVQRSCRTMFSQWAPECVRTTSGVERSHPSVRKMGNVRRKTEIPLPPLAET
jgi:hypothetical protein